MRKRAGKYRHFVRFFFLVDNGDDTFGDDTSTYTAGPTAWVEITPLSGDEQYALQQSRPNVSHRIAARYDDKLDNRRLRMQWGTKMFELTPWVIADERNFEMECTGVEVQAPSLTK